MPTPFMHIAFAHKIIVDPVLPSSTKTLIGAQWGTFLLGSIAPDARVSSGIRRADTHFFEYEPVIAVPPMDAMLTQFPTLNRDQVSSEAQAAFVAGYAAHLAMDEVWCTDLLFPKFMTLWDGSFNSFQMLHMLLGYLDARDYATLEADDYPALLTATPDHWLPFIPDTALIDWRDLIAEQLPPDGRSRTLEILSQRIKMNESEMRAFIDSDELMSENLWQNVPPALVASVERTMYERARASLIAYFAN